MADPVIVSCTEDEWTLVVENKTTGWVYLQGEKQIPDEAYFEFMDTGGAAPSINPGAPGSKAVIMRQQELPFNRSEAVDIYLWPNRENITVLVDAI